MKQRALLLINPEARRGETSEQEVRRELEMLGLDLLVVTEPPDRFSPVIEYYQDQVNCVIVGGGDGSVNAAIEGLLETRLPVGVLPLGTANNLARTLKIPFTLREACQTIAQGRVQPIDLGWVNGEYFLNVAGMGLSTSINQEVPKHFKRRWGVVAYILTALKLALKHRRFAAEIHCDGDITPVKTLQITVCNGRYYGSGLTVAADATIDDQRLDLCSLEIQHWWDMFSLLPALRRGEYASGQGIRLIQGQEIIIYTRRPCLVDTDGEITAHTPATFRVIPDAISVFVP